MQIVEYLDRMGWNYADIVQMVHFLDRKEFDLIVLSLPILNHDLGNLNLQKLNRNIIMQLFS